MLRSRTRVAALALAVLTVLVQAASAEVKPVWKEHPYLFIEKSDVPGVLAKAKQCPWAKTELESLRKEADSWLKREINVPPTTGRHSTSYLCPDCKVALKTLSPTQHQCPKCKKIYSGLPYDAVLYKDQHNALGAAACDLGLASLLLNKPEYVKKSLEILLDYADKYGSYSIVDLRGGQGKSGARVFDQTLNEAIWLVDIARAYDFILGANVATAEQRQTIEDKLLRPSVETVKRYDAGKNNWQSWHNAGIASVALCLQDKKMLDDAVNGSSGFYYQMKNSVLSDGSWYEGSWGYHFYAVSALLKTAESAYRCGIDLYGAPELKRALMAPLTVMMPNNRLPAINDSSMLVGFQDWQYELATARYGDPAFENVIARVKRNSPEALIVGKENPKPQPKALKSAILEQDGLAVLRRGEQYISLDFGPFGGGHGHFDKLAVNYYAAGQVFAPDPGRGWPYNLPIHSSWYKKSLSHNTITVDETCQAACAGVLESHSFEGSYDKVTARVDGAYPGVVLRRTLAMGDDWLLDVFTADSQPEHTYDWVWHGRGEFSTALECKPSRLNRTDASYRYLSSIRKGDGSSDWQAAWSMPGGKVYGLFKGSPGRSVYLCEAPDNPDTDELHSVLLRDMSNKSMFVSLFSAKPMEWKDLPVELQELVKTAK